MAVNDLITFRKGTASAWTSANPVLASGEPGYDLTNKIFKIGDGASNWTSLGSINLASSNITDFNSSVSGLLPVTNIVAGSGITISSSNAIYTINSTATGGTPSPTGNFVVESLHVSNRYTETVSAISISSNTLVINLDTCNLFNCALNSNINTLTISNVPSTSGVSIGFTIIFTADGTPRSVSWPNSVKWQAGTAPNITSVNGKIDTFSFLSVNNGTSWLGFVGGQNY
jgi:hypothetical protein